MQHCSQKLTAAHEETQRRTNMYDARLSSAQAELATRDRQVDECQRLLETSEAANDAANRRISQLQQEIEKQKAWVRSAESERDQAVSARMVEEAKQKSIQKQVQPGMLLF